MCRLSAIIGFAANSPVAFRTQVRDSQCPTRSPAALKASTYRSTVLIGRRHLKRERVEALRCPLGMCFDWPLRVQGGNSHCLKPGEVEALLEAPLSLITRGEQRNLSRQGSPSWMRSLLAAPWRAIHASAEQRRPEGIWQGRMEGEQRACLDRVAQAPGLIGRCFEDHRGHALTAWGTFL